MLNSETWAGKRKKKKKKKRRRRRRRRRIMILPLLQPAAHFVASKFMKNRELVDESVFQCALAIIILLNHLCTYALSIVSLTCPTWEVFFSALELNTSFAVFYVNSFYIVCGFTLEV
jgi:hypothetical protein